MVKSMPFEILNGYLGFFAAWAFVTFALYLWADRKEGYYANRPLIAIMTLFFGDFVVRETVHIARFFINADIEINREAYFALVLVGGAIQIIGMLCMISVFSSKKSRKVIWLYSLIGGSIWTFGWVAIRYFFFTITLILGVTLLSSNAHAAGGSKYGCPETRWCGCWLAKHLQMNANKLGLYVAFNWRKVGKPLNRPQVRAIAIFRHSHVGIVTAVKKGKIRVLSGNDGHAVRDRWRNASTVLAYRKI